METKIRYGNSLNLNQKLKDQPITQPHPPLSLQSSPPLSRSCRNPICLFATDAWQGWILEMAKRLILKNVQDQSFGNNASSILDLFNLSVEEQTAESDGSDVDSDEIRPCFSSITKVTDSLDKELAASGFTRKDQDDIEKNLLLDAKRKLGEILSAFEFLDSNSMDLREA